MTNEKGTEEGVDFNSLLRRLYELTCEGKVEWSYDHKEGTFHSMPSPTGDCIVIHTNIDSTRNCYMVRVVNSEGRTVAYHWQPSVSVDQNGENSFRIARLLARIPLSMQTIGHAGSIIERYLNYFSENK